eukprot:c17758_g1_i1.p1 GENE.c17758_g1_i1~~c17758_g1_i1.p1  ORF type:complete len:195 (+),score=21.22 c17758_g1_i1:125-709(+)
MTMDLWAIYGIVLCCLILLFRPRHHPKGQPPGPAYWPLVGNLLSVPRSHHSFASLSKKFGPIMSLRFGDIPAVVISSPALVQEALHDKSEVFQGRQAPPPLGLRYMTCNSDGIALDVALSNGHIWRLHRKIFVGELMSKPCIDRTLSVMCDEIVRLVQSLEAFHGAQVNPNRWELMFYYRHKRAFFQLGLVRTE